MTNIYIHTYFVDKHILAIHSISDTEREQSIQQRYTYWYNTRCTRSHTTPQECGEKEKWCAIHCRSNNRLHTQTVINEEWMSNSYREKTLFINETDKDKKRVDLYTKTAGNSINWSNPMTGGHLASLNILRWIPRWSSKPL